MDPFAAINNFINSPVVEFSLRFLQLTAAVLWIVLAIWAYRDAKARGALAPFWAALAVLLPYVGALIYLLARPPEFRKDVLERELEIKMKEQELLQLDVKCPSCQNRVEADFIVCPFCMKRLKKICDNCRKPLSMAWSACPYCGNVQEMKIRLEGKGETSK